jgi:hypothetical protein
MDRNLYLCLYPWVEIYIYRVSGGYQIPVRFVISHVKIRSK